MMDKNDNLFAIKGRGCPSKEQTEQLVLHGELKNEIKTIRKDMSMQNGKEILLSITIADDGMQRHVHMFPEVMFMDVIANTNRQKRDLFLMIVKDASGECFIGNATLLPCGQLWVFTKLYRYFFYQLYGPNTLSRLRIALTDDDSACHGAFDAAAKVMTCYANAKHMLCVFHAIVMKYHDTVYGKLPKMNGTRELTAKAALYGASFMFYIASIYLISVSTHLPF